MKRPSGFDYRSEVIGLAQEMVRVNTVNPPGGEAVLARLIAERLRSYGVPAEVTLVAPGRANVTGRLAGRGGHSALLLSGHLDTVPPGEAPWAHDPFGGELVGGRLYGRGAADMKGGLAAAVVAAGLLAREGVLSGDVVVSAVAGEEVDSLGARRFVADGGLAGVGLIVVAEPTGLRLALAEKGALWVSVTTHGRAAHGSMPWHGVNAISHLTLFLNELAGLDLGPAHPVLGPPTVNVGTISGGVKTNVVPDRCTATLDFRTVPGLGTAELRRRLEGLLAELGRRIPEFRAELQVLNAREPVETDPAHPWVGLAQGCCRKLGLSPEPATVNFYTDAAVLAEEPGHPPVLIFGPGAQEMAHQPDEHVETEELVRAVEFYCELARTYLST
ncbi:MAG TPA: M20 family metallopeptidase [Firmicutes bacterium]|nr:M20 family metallopeptidase [Bacillota bacterium]